MSPVRSAAAAVVLDLDPVVKLVHAVPVSAAVEGTSEDAREGFQ